jgi:hypothetical protein
MTLHSDSGFSRATCMDTNDPARVSKPLFGFAFQNANGIGTATYNPHQEAVAMQVTSWQLDQTSIVLEYPDVFLPKEFITDTLRQVVNASTVAANAYLYDHPYVLPPGFQAKVPNPYVHLRHQSGCCNNIHGLVEITSTIPRPAAAALNVGHDELVLPSALSVKSSPHDFAQQDISSAIRVTVYQDFFNTSNACSLTDTGTQATLVTLYGTFGQCQPLTVDLSKALFGFDINDGNTTFGYSLTLLLNGSIDFQFMCYGMDPKTATCNACVFDIQGYSDWSQSCIVSDSDPTTTIYLQKYDTSPCVGTTTPVEEDSLFLSQYTASTSCGITDQGIVTLINLGPFSSAQQPFPCSIVATQGQELGFSIASSTQGSGLTYRVDAFCPVDSSGNVPGVCLHVNAQVCV